MQDCYINEATLVHSCDQNALIKLNDGLYVLKSLPLKQNSYYDVEQRKITNVPEPTDDTDVVPKGFLTKKIKRLKKQVLLLDEENKHFDCNGYKVTNLGNAENDTDAITVLYLRDYLGKLVTSTETLDFRFMLMEGDSITLKCEFAQHTFFLDGKIRKYRLRYENVPTDINNPGCYIVFRNDEEEEAAPEMQHFLSESVRDDVNISFKAGIRTLSSAEAKYSQTEKEALAIVFATSKLRQYLFGRKFVLKSDHKALMTVFGNKRLLPPLIANRLHRWALELSNFDFDIRYTNKDSMLCADAFSRLPLEEINSREDNIDLVTHDISFLNVTPLDHLIIEEETNKDPVLNKLKEYLLEDPQLAKKDETMKPFLSKLENISILQGCIFVDSRAVIPRTCQDQILKLLHQGHIGINRMKSLARSSVWWPKMDSQIEEFVKECSPCMHHQTAPPAENTPWPRTNQPWQRVHVDHFYFRGDCYLLEVDANSNWIEVFPVRVKNLKGTFKVHVNQMRTGSDTKYAEDSDWTLNNAGAGPHRLEQDPQISTSPSPRRSTRPRCPPCRFSPTMYNIRKEE
ncbi:K02A2.6-like [Cordylochernes scorpioides]|uniref:RNA-directed DNA polymerase n=1 Tax=Cordylochernes scorpioides TaxID=51811 RepID=A0ABY6LVY3_9ARAC|nr:K02A2.6-like [Cordylochernes scorpioides]